MSAAIQDPLDFVADAIEAEGALCERSGGGAEAILPPRLAARLEIPEECRVTVHPEGKGDVACGLGSPLLERLVTEARARCPAASIRLDADPPRPAHVRAVAERFALRNGLAEIGQVTLGPARYVIAYAAYAVEADDRREGILRVVAGPDGGEPDEGVQDRLDLAWPDAIVSAPGPIGPTGDAPRWIATRVARAARGRAEPFVAEVARRQSRDHERIAAYFEALVAEARAPRRKTEQGAVDAKVGHLIAERDKKLRDLGERYAIRVRASLAAIAWAEVPAAQIAVKLRRRKEAREITLRVPSGAASFDRIACEGCGAPTAKPAACDDRLHLLCEACAPSAQGRIACPACMRR